MPRDRRRASELSYLVFFVADPVDDALAGQVVERVRALAGARAWSAQPPGWFDDPGAETAAERTTGGYLRTDSTAGEEARAVFTAVLALSGELGVHVELQFREELLGQVRRGEADRALRDAFGPRG